MTIDGKMTDVLIKDDITIDPTTGIKRISGLQVWADAGLKETIQDMPGVHRVIDFDTLYFISLDKRYDHEWMKAEIEAVIKCRLQ
jgi:hypothetical protein